MDWGKEQSIGLLEIAIAIREQTQAQTTGFELILEAINRLADSPDSEQDEDAEPRRDMAGRLI